MEVFKLFGTIIIDNDAANNSLKKTDQQAEKSGKSMTNTFKKIGTALIAGFSIQKIKEFGTECIEAYKVQEEAETKLETIMRQRMNATDKSIQSVKDLTAAQQELGVVGDEVQMAGAQQLATFLNNDEALKKLIPAMNDLAVQQNGVNVSSGNMVSIGNLMGKVMQGQTGALKKVGITFTAAQEKVLKYGNEQERAAMLAEVITGNVGHMNAEIAKTDDGKQQQYKNTLGDLQEVIGQKLIPFQTIYYKGLATLGTYLVNNLSPVLDGIIKYGYDIGNFMNNHKGEINNIIILIGALTTAILGFKAGAVLTSVISSFQDAKLALSLFSASQGAANIAQAALNGTLTVGETLVALLTGKVTLAQLASALWTKTQAGLNAVLSANPIGIVIALITGLVAAFVVAYNNSETFRNKVNSAFKAVQSVVGSVVNFIKKNIVDNIGNAISSAIKSFNSLKNNAINTFNSVKNSIINPLNSAKAGVKGVIDSIKSFFKFKITWPKVPLPHFNVKPKGWGVGDLLKGKIPSLGIDWYSKAMDGGMILNSPTIFGQANGKLLGAGEAGSETVVGTKSLMNMITQAVSTHNDNEILYDIYDILSLILEALGLNFSLNLNGKQLATELTPDINKELNRIKNKKRRV